MLNNVHGGVQQIVDGSLAKEELHALPVKHVEPQNNVDIQAIIDGSLKTVGAGVQGGFGIAAGA